MLGSGFTLLALGADPAQVSGFEAAAEKHGVPLTVIRDDGGQARADYAASLVLVRPDQFVAWAGESGAPGTILRRAAGHPA